MPNNHNRKEEEILRKQKALYSELSKSNDKPAPPPAPSKTIPNHRKPASLSELLGGKPQNRKPPPTTAKPLHSIHSSIPKKNGKEKEIIDLTTDSPEKISLEKKEKPNVIMDKPKTMLKNTMTTTSNTKSKTMPPPPQQQHPPNVPSTNIKRPSVRKRKQMDAAIDAARQRIKDANTIMGQKQTNDAISKSIATKPSTKSGGLSSLLNQAGITNKQLHTKASAQTSWVEEEDRHGTLLEVEDYFKCMREWDFLKDWNMERCRNTNQGKQSSYEQCKIMEEGETEEENDLKAMNAQIVLPNVFTSRKQYQTLWAPLCLKEAKAQILSDASGSLPWKNVHEIRENVTGNRKRGTVYLPVPVVVRPKVQKSSLYPESFNVQIESNMKVQGLSFGAGDIVVLAHKESYFSDASKGRLKVSNHRFCIVGNVEYSLRGLDGLKVIVSRKCWYQLCEDRVEVKMYLLNLGCSVTNVREFTALCKINTVPLLPYILCRKISKAADNLDTLSNTLCGNISASRKHEHLLTMGGKTALGEGFMKYASSKFNHSQLGAISAAAREYGDGGFTLIKGPPGMRLTHYVGFLCVFCFR
jgi:senataxin